MTAHAAPRLQLLLAAALFSTGGAAIKALSLTSWQVACLRSAVAAAAVALLVPQARRGWTRQAVLTGAVYAATMVLYVAAAKRTTAANAIFLQSAAPLYILLAGPWLLRERISRLDLGVILAVAGGLALVVLGGGPPLASAPDPALGNLLATLSGICWAGTVIGLRRLGASDREAVEPSPRRGDPALATVLLGNLIAAVVCLPGALPLGGASGGDLALVLYLGVAQIGLAYFLVARGLRGVPAFEASLLLLLEPVLSPLWAWLAQGERPSALALGGGALILAATAARALRARLRPAEPSGSERLPAV